MSALTVGHEPGQGWDDLVRLWEGTDAPEGCKVEIIEGVVTLSPTPSNGHNDIAETVQRQLYSVIAADWGIYQTLALALPSRHGMYIPDLVVVPKDALFGDKNHIPADAAELVVEITSQSNAGHDRITKAAGYAQAGIPLHLLIDRWAPGGPTVTLYGEPTGDVYRTLTAGKFGEAVMLPAPFELSIETSLFPGR
ncbi:Uma2 family endonuclease [Streptomyces sp. ASQP_92]|uniref:Uma2 family endonuclease n=1 Tax=Streptomyces sp. ASQP_92 TaxID=2979116 RepID=UPI0021BE9A23|nr:Uma2 family endonuclease [Streptomyces sp. ASQP_92]MCT9089455.1 Uma2 family endonuclease [Streptomyces sp. ASQP_92]